MRILALTQIPAVYSIHKGSWVWDFFHEMTRHFSRINYFATRRWRLSVSPQLFALWCGKIINNYEWVEEKRVEKSFKAASHSWRVRLWIPGPHCMIEFDSMTSPKADNFSHEYFARKHPFSSAENFKHHVDLCGIFLSSLLACVCL